MPLSSAPDWPLNTFMAGLDPATGQEFMALSLPAHRKTGDILIRQGETDDRRVFLLRSTDPRRIALVKVTKYLENGEQLLLGIRVSGDLVGEMASVRDSPRVATVTLCSDCLVYAIPDAAFTAFIERHPKASRGVTRLMADRLDWANRRREGMSGYDVSTRLATVLIELADRHGSQVERGLDLGVPLTQVELGRLIGAGEDAVGNAMRTMNERGLAQSNYGRVIILDLPGLRNLYRQSH
ncbi:Crp/Fnr family transcriptional regulator [Acrocarpospora sp. B8E8]|uniref:Crp/Fnr family transcriptional regulator n=1 Tax=Acrocarpospora sp. B8E8 TaxID=3153572 RepID=UPI00325E4836